MCISGEVSISAFVFCSITCVYLYKRNRPNDRWIAIMFGYLGTMQLLEYFMWIDQECSGLNQIATDLGFIHNILQPVISLSVAYYFTSGKIPSYMYLIFILYLFTSLPEIIKVKKVNQCSKPCSEENIGLSWEYTNTKYPTYVWAIFCLALVVPFLSMKINSHIYSLFLIGIYIASHFIAKNRCQGSIIPSNGSWWCLMAVFGPLIALFINK